MKARLWMAITDCEERFARELEAGFDADGEGVTNGACEAIEKRAENADYIDAIAEREKLLFADVLLRFSGILKEDLAEYWPTIEPRLP